MVDFTCNPEEIGARIRILRKRLQKTQTYFADLLYISPSYLALIESGKRTPTIEILIQISKMCDVSVDYLLFGNDSGSFDANQKTFDRLCENYSSEKIRKALNLAEYYLELDSENDAS